MVSSRSLARLLLGTCSLAVTGCATSPPIAIEASPTAIHSLVGEWDGTYTSRDTGRSGSIWFKLVAGEDHAHGDVLMTPRGRRDPYHRSPPTAGSLPDRPADLTQVLTIQFVHTAEGTVDGRLEPYWDPDCQCRAVTTFRGRLNGDRLEGTFTTQLGVSGQASGRWVAHRRRLASLWPGGS